MSKKEIDKYMFVSEAAERWGESVDAVKMRLRQSKEIDDMVAAGELKYYIKPGGTRKNWIISEAAMKRWYGDKK